MSGIRDRVAWVRDRVAFGGGMLALARFVGFGSWGGELGSLMT